MNDLEKEAWNAYCALIFPDRKCEQGGKNKPLLEMLREAIIGTTGTEGTGSGGVGLTLNHNAIELDTEIGVTLYEFAKEQKTARHANRETLLERYFNHTRADRHRHQISLHQYETRMHNIIDWADRIWELYNGHTPSPAGGPCPNCKTRWVHQAGVRKEAVIVYTHPEKPPYAECTECCHKITVEDLKRMMTDED